MRVRYKEAATHTGIPQGTLRAMVCTKTIPHIRIGPRMVLFDIEQLDRWLAERTVQPGARETQVGTSATRRSRPR
jgi:excisionase family DNA binding protein